MKKNPFSIYDFLGYVFPGLLTLYLIWFFVTDDKQLNGISDLTKRIIEEISGTDRHSTLSLAIEETIIITVGAYVVGHFVAYLSSITVEQFAIWVYDYPSKFLLKDIPSNHFWNSDGDLQLSLGWKRFWRILISIFLLPILTGTYMFGEKLRLRQFFIKKLDEYLIKAIDENKKLLAQFLGIKQKDDMDFHRVIYHYEYELMSRHSQKMDNYVALYGFLRSLAFISNCTFIWILFHYGIMSIGRYPDFNGGLVILLLMLWIITYILFMAFMKFYRRFTLESLMCLVTDTSYKRTEAATIPNYSYTDTQQPSSIIIPNQLDHQSISR